MRLIDADKLKDELVKHFDAYFNDKGQLMYSDHICTSDDVSDLFDLIDKQPTAYDVDKTVQQLGNLNKYNLNLADAMLDIQENGINRHFICLEDAIEIVKAGGNP